MGAAEGSLGPEPLSADELIGMGQAALRQGRWDDAEGCLLRALAYWPQDVDGRYLLAACKALRPPPGRDAQGAIALLESLAIEGRADARALQLLEDLWAGG
jgi:uncharacterized protein HemY